MRASSHPGRAGQPRAVSRHDAGTVSPAALRLAQEADATMSPDGRDADYFCPEMPLSHPLASPLLLLPPGTPPTA